MENSEYELNYPKLRSIMSQIQEPCMFVKGAKFPKWGTNFLGNLAPRGPYFLGNLARGLNFRGGQISCDTVLQTKRPIFTQRLRTKKTEFLLKKTTIYSIFSALFIQIHSTQ